MKKFRLIHKNSNTILANGPKKGIKSLEGNYYIKNKYRIARKFQVNYIPGLCFYKFFYVWVDLIMDEKTKIKSVGWKYVIPNPLFFWTIWFSVGVPQSHPDLKIEYYDDHEDPFRKMDNFTVLILSTITKEWKWLVRLEGYNSMIE